MWGSCVLIPELVCQNLLHELHLEHPSICRMKSLTQTVIWWPSIDSDIKEMVKGCQECQLTRAAPVVSSLNPLPWPSKP